MIVCATSEHETFPRVSRVYEGDPSSGGCAKHVVSPLEIRTPIVRSFVDTDDQPDTCM